MIGEREGFAAQIDAIRRYEEGREVGSPRRKGPLMTNDDNNLQKNTAFKGKKTTAFKSSVLLLHT